MPINKEEINILEKKLTSVVKSVINEKFEQYERRQQEMFEKHEKIVANLISDNLKILHTRLDKVDDELDEVTDSNLVKQEQIVNTLQTK